MPERQLKTYGRQFTMTREAFINDDIGLLTTMPQRYAALSANTQNKLVYQILTQNKKIYDGKAYSVPKEVIHFKKVQSQR